MSARSALLLSLLVVLLVGSSARAKEPAPLRRFALTVAANDGGPGRPRLQYAQGDARALGEVLEQLGGVDAGDAVHLVQPGARELSAAFGALGQRVREAEQRGVRTELIFYYSGHSDDTALLLGKDRVDYATLRKWLDELPAQVRIAILDSCASGAFTREKGGLRRAPFMVDVSTQVRGHAFLTSSSADEAAQESDRIGGSFFTHYLVSGLRGAADASGDRKITLTEAYRFAFDETLARTARTQYGIQHPAYEIRLAGTGDLVMTDLRSTEAELVIDESVEGRLFVWDEARKLSVEVDKLAGRRVALALPPGTYRVELSRGAHFLVAEVRALAGQPASLGKAAFKDSERESTLARGVVDQFALHPFAASVIAPFSTNHVVRHAQRRPVLNHIGVAALYDDPDALEGFQLGLFGLGARRYAKGLQLAAVFTDAGELQGAQLSFVANVTRSFASGLQLSSLVNYTGERLRGIQAAAGINYTALAHGAQLGLGINVAREELTGTQVGGLNWARTGRGMQAGLVNLAREVHGLQLGAVNVAAGGVRGAQLGLINYADEADFSLALLGITRQGGAHVQLAFDELLAPAFALQLHAKYNYSFVQAALAPFGDERRGYTLGAGLGFKAPTRLSKLWVDSEFGFHMVQPLHDFKRHLPNSLYRIRVLARYELQPHFSVFAGLTLNVYLQLEEADRFLPRALVMMHEATRASSTGQVYYWPGFVFGVRL